MEKLKSRLDAFSDGIMAVIITIMVLSISPVLHDNLANYLSLAKTIGIYLITFAFIANMWYQHSTAFAEIKMMTYRILIWDMIFLASLSLMPLFTDMMAENTTQVTVMLYGLMQGVVNIFFRCLATAIIHFHYTEAEDMQRVYQKIYGKTYRWLSVLSVIAVITAYFLPHVAVIFFMAYPVLSFFLNADARQQMFDASALPVDERQDLAQLPAKDFNDWRKTARQLFADQTKTTDSTKGEAANLTAWLNQNIDPRRRRRFARTFDQLPPETKRQMAAWFAQHRH